MADPSETLVALRDRAIAGVEDLISVLGAGRVVGVAVPADDELRAVLARTGRLDIPGLAADARRLAAVHRVVADQMHRLPEQQVRLDHGWSSGAGAVAVGLVIEHQRRAEADLAVVRSVAEATSAAAAGIDQILRTWYRTVARLSSPLVAGVPLPELPAAVLTGRVPPAVVAADITSRIALLTTTAHATQSGVQAILSILTRSADEWDLTQRTEAPARVRVPDGDGGSPDERGDVPVEGKVPTPDAARPVAAGQPAHVTVTDGSPAVEPKSSPAPDGPDVPFTLTAEEAGTGQTGSSIQPAPRPEPAPAAESPSTPLADPTPQSAPTPAPNPGTQRAPASDLALAGDQ